MTAFRSGVCLLAVVLVIVPALGFATGDQALHLWDHHPRDASNHLGAPHVAWKTTPAAVTPSPPIPPVRPAAFRALERPPAPTFVGVRPPFVPPRV
jgi:hypothetical protein